VVQIGRHYPSDLNHWCPVQAGGLPPGRELAAQLAEAVFTPLHTLEIALRDNLGLKRPESRFAAADCRLSAD
jgi:hypothetical protein